MENDNDDGELKIGQKVWFNFNGGDVLYEGHIKKITKKYFTVRGIQKKRFCLEGLDELDHNGFYNRSPMYFIHLEEKPFYEKQELNKIKNKLFVQFNKFMVVNQKNIENLTKLSNFIEELNEKNDIF